MALVVSIRPSFFISKDIYPFVKNLENKVNTLVDEVYPQELEIKIKNGYASSNVTEPYYLTIRKETLENIFSLKENEQISKSKVRILAIDTKSKAEEFEKYQSQALLTETSLVYYQEGNINIQSLRGIQNLTISKELIKSKIAVINKDNTIVNLATIGIFVSPLFLILILGGFIGQLIKFFLISLLIYLMVRINQLSVGFKNTFRYTAALTFWVMILGNIVSFVPRLAEDILAVETILTVTILGLAYSCIFRLKNETSGAEESGTPATVTVVLPNVPESTVTPTPTEPSDLKTPMISILRGKCY